MRTLTKFAKYARIKRDFLGMSSSNAHIMLVRMMLFRLVQQFGLDVCFRCDRKIKTLREFSLDHEKNWLYVDPALYWDLDNIKFSHLSCNSRHRWHPLHQPMPGGALMFIVLRRCLDLTSNFHRNRLQPNGYHNYCKGCRRDFYETRKSAQAS